MHVSITLTKKKKKKDIKMIFTLKMNYNIDESFKYAKIIIDR